MASNERAVSTVVSEVIDNVEDIIRAEMRLAKAELRTEAAKAAKSGSLLASGAVLALYGFGLLLAVIVLVLSQFLAAWLATLITFGVVMLIAGGLLLAGQRRLRHLNVAPKKTVQSVKQTVESVKEDMSWPKTQLR